MIADGVYGYRRGICLGVVSICFVGAGCGGAQTTCTATVANDSASALRPSTSAAETTAERPSDELQARAVDIVGALYGQHADETYATFGESFRVAVPIEKFREVNASVVRSNGAFRDARFATVLVPRGAGVHRFAVVGFFKDAAALHTLSFDEHDVLIGLMVRPLVLQEGHD